MAQASSPFAFCIPGRPLSLTEAITDTQFVGKIAEPQDLNHLCLFTTMPGIFPEGYGATVHFQFPGGGFQCVGMLSNAKQSAIFKLRGAMGASTSSFGSGMGGGGAMAMLGVNVEPLASCEAQVAALNPSIKSLDPSTSTALVRAGAPTTVDPITLAQQLGRNLFNHVAGFATSGPDGRPWVPVEALEKWFAGVERKVRLGGIGFLQSD